jgi:hypothetical protein
MPKGKRKANNSHRSPSLQSNELASLVGLKDIVKKYFPESSTARCVILSEPDQIPISEALIKFRLYYKMLTKDLEKLDLPKGRKK